MATAAMGTFFAYAVVVQFNDPDPVRWIAVYGVASVLSFAAVRAPLPPVWPALPAALAFAWALTWLPGAIRTSFAEMFRTYQMMSPAMEEGREELGLLLVVAWMLVLAGSGARVRGGRGAADAAAPAP
jgi:hypothetical protein